MKTLIAATIISLASGTAGAFDLSTFDSQEFYSGQDNDHNIVINPNVVLNNDNLFSDGHFPKVTPGLDSIHDKGVVDTDFPAELYTEAHWPV